MNGDELITIKILRALQEKGAANPGDIVAVTGLPRYLVLASFQVLYELGYIDLIYSKGSHKVYKPGEKGIELLEETPVTKKEEAIA